MADTVTMSCHLLAAALRRTEHCHAVAATTPKRALQLLEKGRFDVAIVGLGFSGDALQSIRFVRQLRSLHPELSILVLLDGHDRNLVVETFRAGARGIFSRSDSFEALCKCIQCLHEGQVWASSRGLQFVLEALVEHGPAVSQPPGARPLSKREEQITFLVAEGYSNRQISEHLDLSEHTVKNYLFRVFEKLGVSTRVGLTLYALRQGQISQPKLPGFKPLSMPDLPQRSGKDPNLQN
ncbi:MAG: response regulator transcription factor [Acidobacteriia bacterium]|nr:response regulator transcription factor [Terriglobia bacterium]